MSAGKLWTTTRVRDTAGLCLMFAVILSLVGAGCARKVPEDKIAQVKNAMSVEGVISLLGKPARVWKRPGDPDTDIILLYEGEERNYRIQFASLAGRADDYMVAAVHRETRMKLIFSSLPHR